MSSSPQPFFSVIIVNYNAGARIERCIDALQQQTDKDFHVILIDNASTDGSLDLAQQAFEASSLMYEIIRSETNLGFAAGNNEAVKRAKGQWLAFLNPDAYAFPDWLERLRAAISLHPQAGSFGSLQIDAKDPAKLDGSGDVFHVLGVPYRGAFGHDVDSLPDQHVEVASACAAASIVRADLFSRVGGFEESFFCYLEDIDLGLKLQSHGYPTIQANDAKVYHEGSGISLRDSDFTLFHGNRNRLFVVAKHFPAALFWGLFIPHLGSNLIFLCRAVLRRQGKIYLKALLHGYAGMAHYRRLRAAEEKKLSVDRALTILSFSLVKLMRRAPHSWTERT